MKSYEWARNEANKNPQKIAISLNGCHLSYGKLESLSNRLSGMLLIAGLKPGDRVGFLMNKTPDCVIAMHGINKAGGVYVPIDSSCPAEQIARTIRKADLFMIIVDKATTPVYLKSIDEDSTIRNLSWIWWSKDDCIPEGQKRFSYCLHEIEQHPNHPYDRVDNEHEASQILFSSNEASQPQGVVISHNNISNFVNWAVSYFDIEPHDRISGYAPFHTDSSIFDIYGSMAAGAHLYLLPDEISLAPQKLSEFILEHDITQWFSSSAALNYMALFDVIPKSGFSGLKRIIWRGDDFPQSSIKYWMEQNADSIYTAIYGSPETTIANSYYTLRNIPSADESIPLGSPCAGINMLVLDHELNAVRDGEIGDLYISGNGISSEYWKAEKNSHEKFRDMFTCTGEKIKVFKTGKLASFTPKGLYYYHGNAENRNQYLTFQFDLNELEFALSKEKKLREYAVIPVKKNEKNGAVLGCAYVTTGNENGEIPPILKKKL